MENIPEINFMPDTTRYKKVKNIMSESESYPPERIAEIDEDLLWNT